MYTYTKISVGPKMAKYCKNLVYKQPSVVIYRESSSSSSVVTENMKVLHV